MPEGRGGAWRGSDRIGARRVSEELGMGRRRSEGLGGARRDRASPFLNLT